METIYRPKKLTGARALFSVFLTMLIMLSFVANAQFSVTVNIAGQGSVTLTGANGTVSIPAPGGTTAAIFGGTEVVTLVANASPLPLPLGHGFWQWTGAVANQNAANTSVAMGGASKTIGVDFRKIHTLTFSVPTTKMYDGTDNSSFSNVNVTPVLGMGVTLSLPANANYVTATGEPGVIPLLTKNIGVNKSVHAIFTLAGATAGTDMLQGTSPLFPDKTVTATNKSAITVYPLAVAALPYSKTYDGNVSSVVAPVMGALLGTDVVTTPAIQTFDNKNWGSNKKITPSGLVINDGNHGFNYAVSYIPVSGNTISKKGLTVDGGMAKNQIYNKTSNTTIHRADSLVPIHLVGVVPGEVVTLGLSNNGNFRGTFYHNVEGTWYETAHVGNHTVRPNPAMAIAGPDAGNYLLTQPEYAGTIFALPLALSPIVIQDKVYYAPYNTPFTNTTATVLDWGSLSGVIAPDVVTIVTGSASASFADVNIGIDKPVTVIGVGLAGLNAGDYSLANQATTGKIIPPVYAMFNPTYKIQDASKHSDGNTTINYVPNVRVTTELSVDFSDPIYDANGFPINTSGIGDLVKLEKGDINSPDSWVPVLTSSNMVGNKITLTLTGATKLQFGTTYRLSYSRIFSPPGFPHYSQNVIYTCDKDAASDSFKPELANALYNGPYKYRPFTQGEVFFQTMPELPIVKPYGNNADVCMYPTVTDPSKKIVLEFMNPVKYQDGQNIIDPPKNKFAMIMVKPNGQDSVLPWSAWDLTINTPVNPTVFTFTTTAQMQYCTTYKIYLREGFDLDYGFIDKVHGTDVLVPTAFTTIGSLNYGTSFVTLQGADGWWWKTKCEYAFKIDLGDPEWPEDIEFGHRPNNLINVALVNTVGGGGGSAPAYQWQSGLDNSSFQNYAGTTSGYAITYGPPPGYAINKQEIFQATSPETFNGLAAINGEGYHWVSWEKNGVVVNTTGPVLPFSFMAEQPPCVTMNEYHAKFAINTYTVVPKAFNETNTVEKTAWGTVTSSPVNPVVHGSQVTVTAVPKPGYYFVGWEYDGLTALEFAPVQVVPKYYNGVTPRERFIQDPQLDVATLKFWFKGNFTHGQVVNVHAKFAPYEPIIRFASGLEGTGEQPTDEVGLIQITYHFTPPPPGGNEVPNFQNLPYQYARIIYGKTVTLKAIPITDPCDKYHFVKWQIWTPDPVWGGESGTWSTFSTTPTTSVEIGPITMNRDYRFKAVYEKKNVLITAAPITHNPDLAGQQLGSVVFIREGINDTVNPTLILHPDDIQRIVVHSEPETYPWEWEDGLGNIIPRGTGPGQIDTVPVIPVREDRTVWDYRVGCNAANLKAVFDYKEYAVTVYTKDKKKGTVGGSFPVFNAALGHQGGLGFTFMDTTRIEFPHDTIIGQFGEGLFQRTKMVTFVATPATGYKFKNWTTSFGTKTANPYISPALTGSMYAIANFELIVPPTTFNVFATSADPLRGTVTGGGVYQSAAPPIVGDEVTLIAEALPGFTFSHWEYSGQPIVPALTASQLLNPVVEFIMPQGDVSFVAYFVQTVYSVNTHCRTYLRAVNPAQPDEFTVVSYGGYVSPTATQNLVAGAVIHLTAVENQGFTFVSWMIGEIQDQGTNRILRGKQIGSTMDCYYTIPSIAGNPTLNIYGVFVEIADPPYIRNSVSTSPNPFYGGSTTGGGNYPYGVEVYLAQKPNMGYLFTGWTGGYTPTPCTDPYAAAGFQSFFVPMSPVNLQAFSYKANYSKINYELKVFSENVMYGSVTPDTAMYTMTTPAIEVTATPKIADNCNTYSFVGWFRNAACTDTLRSAGGAWITDTTFFFLPEAPASGIVTLYAQFKATPKVYTINALWTPVAASTSTLTKVTPIMGATFPFNCGEKALVETVPNPGYAFQHWVNADATMLIEQPSFVYEVTNENQVFTAVYNIITYHVGVDPSIPAAGGTAVTTPANGNYTVGQTVTVTATPNPGYGFTPGVPVWEVISGVIPVGTILTNPVLTYTMQAGGNATVRAMFTHNVYTLTANALAGGSVNPLTQNKFYNEPVTVTATADVAFSFSHWTATGMAVPTGNPANFLMPNGNATLTAHFVTAQYPLTLVANPLSSGTFTTTPNQTSFVMGATVVVTTTNVIGFSFSSWSGLPAGAVLSNGNKTVTFTMPGSPLTLTANFIPDNRIFGQVKYFNQYETVMPATAKIKVALDNNGVLSQIQDLHPVTKLDNNGNPVVYQQAYEFVDIVPSTNYTIRLWEAPTGGTIANTWSYTHSTGCVNSQDALIISYMVIENSGLYPQFQWLTNGAIVPYWTEFFGGFAGHNNNVANVDNDPGNITNGDASWVMYRSINYPGFNPAYPGGAFNFQVAGTTILPGATQTYPLAPTTVFNQVGTYSDPTAAASSLYHKGVVTGTVGTQQFNLYYAASGDVNASYIPSAVKSTSSLLAYNDILKVNVGDQITIPVTIDQNITAGAMNIGFTYNKDLLKVTGVEGFNFFSIDEATGTVRAAMFDVNGSSFSKNSNVISIKATVLAPIAAGTRYFELEENTIFSDINAVTIDGLTLTTPYITTDNTTSIGDKVAMSLTHKAFPNPFNTVSNIQYTLPETASVEVNVYNSLGGLVKTFVNETQVAGLHTVQLKNTDLNGAGVYFYKIIVKSDSRNETGTGSLVLIK